MHNCNFNRIYRDEVHNCFQFHDDGVLGSILGDFSFCFHCQHFLCHLLYAPRYQIKTMTDGSVGSTVHNVGSIANYLMGVGSLSLYSKYYLSSNRGVRNTLRCQMICLHLLCGGNKHS